MSKDSRIEIRINSEEKKQLEEKIIVLDMSMSEYFRHLYIHGEVLIVPEQVQKDIRGLSINVNQIARRLNGGSITQVQVINQLQEIVLELKNIYIR